MAEVTYVGPEGAVSVPMPDGFEIEVAYGENLTTTNDMAASLCEQPANWAPVVAEAPAPKKTKAAKDEAE